MGCCTAKCVSNTKGCFYAYIALMIIIVGVQCATVGLAIHYKSSFKEHGEDYMTKTLTAGYVGPFKEDSDISMAWDAAQILLRCCAVSGQDDYRMLSRWDTRWKTETAVIPSSCCKITSIKKTMEMIFKDMAKDIMEFLKDPTCPVSRSESHTKGCFDAITEAINQYVLCVIAVGVALIVLELIAMAASCFLFPKVQKSPENAYKMRRRKH
ncbi:tetraspanin-9-like isoform X2 [Gigantopelta aegis]|nr:tetraspanin-9-like isoform X2 [Gigantopelta aegis]